jgi:hypothetical protein
MGAVCAKPPMEGEMEYYGPPDRPRNVPLDLKQWKILLAEQIKRQPQQSGGSSAATTTSPSNASDGFVTPGGTRIERMKETQSEEMPKPPTSNGALAVI